MSLNELLVLLVSLFDLTVLLIVLVYMSRGKATWRHCAVRAAVLFLVAGLGADFAHGIEMLIHGTVGFAPQYWVLTDIGGGVLLMLDVFKPSVYLIDDFNNDNEEAL